MLGGVDGQRRALGLQPAACLGVVRRALTRREQGDQARGGRGVLDDALPRPGQPGQLAQPLDDDLLDLRQRRGGLPRDAERAEAGGGQVAQRGTEGRVGREPAEVARVLHLGHARDHDGFEVGQEAGEGFGLLRRSGGKFRPPHRGPPAPAPATPGSGCGSPRSSRSARDRPPGTPPGPISLPHRCRWSGHCPRGPPEQATGPWCSRPRPPFCRLFTRLERSGWERRNRDVPHGHAGFRWRRPRIRLPLPWPTASSSASTEGAAA